MYNDDDDDGNDYTTSVFLPSRYFVFTSKHHDGFCNWGSTYSYGWNSMAVGPKRDVLAELSGALRARHPDVHFGLYYSLFEWFNPIYLKDKDRKYHSRCVRSAPVQNLNKARLLLPPGAQGIPSAQGAARAEGAGHQVLS